MSASNEALKLRILLEWNLFFYLRQKKMAILFIFKHTSLSIAIQII